MPFAPNITNAFNTRGLVGLVLSNATFAQRGYLWGYDGRTYYCFFNPDKIFFEIWKKRWHLAPFLALGIGAVIGFLVGGGPIGAAAGAFLTLFVPFLVYKHYYQTAAEQIAAVITNGPQMRLPFNMSFTTVAVISVLLVVAPTIYFTMVGLVVTAVASVASGGTIHILGPISVTPAFIGFALGALTGVNLVALFLFLLGLFATPYGSVVTPIGIGESVTPSVPYTYYFNRDGTGFSAYSVDKDNPPGAWGSGGLEPMIINGAVATTISGPIAVSYDNLVANPRPEVLWGLIPLDLSDQNIREALASQDQYYKHVFPSGLVVVVGNEAWTNGDTFALRRHGCMNAVATDGSQSAMLAATPGDFKIGGAWSILNLGSYRDPIQRYGFKAVPD